MKFLVRYLSMTSLLLISSLSWATASKPVETPLLFNCSVSFTATGQSIYVGLGYTSIHGTGTMTCYDYLRNSTEQIPLKVKIKGPGAGLGVTGLSISGGQGGLGLHTSPDALIGTYLVIRGNAALGGGGALSSGIKIGNGAAYLTVQIEGTSGLGFGVDLLSFELERDHRKKPLTAANVNQPAPQPTLPAPQAEPKSVVERVRLNQVVEVVDDQGAVVGRYQFQHQ
jgi:hypothetical protein